MKTGKTKLLLWGDAVVPTGFSRVLHSIIQKLPQEEYDISWLGINYYGDPHAYTYRIYPAAIKNDLWGLNRIEEVISREKPDVIFMLNDIWVISKALHVLKDVKNLPPIVVYFPVDGTDFNKRWFEGFGIVSKTVVYTQFGKQVVEDCGIKNINISIIPHGIAKDVFFPINKPKKEIKKLLFTDREEFTDSFIVLNANRNQPRKRIDIFLEAFKQFSEGKPENVKVYCHMGLIDAGWNISDLAVRYGIDSRLIVSNQSGGVQIIPDNRLNFIYNATDLGVNTGIGEGWGLVNMEHAVTGAPQIVGDHSACHELYEDCGILVPAPIRIVDNGINISHFASKPEDFATAMDKIYNDKELYSELSKKVYDKFTNEQYSWENVAKQWHEVFQEVKA